MPSGLRKTTGNHFEIYYEQPWGGVASDKDPVDIAENQLVVQQGVVACDNVLAQFNLPGDPDRFKWSPATGSPNALPWVIFELVGALYACDQYGQIYSYSGDLLPVVADQFSPVRGPLPARLPVLAPDFPWVNPPAAVQVINGQAYITNPGNTSIYVFTPTPVVGTFVLASNYVGGYIVGVLDDYMLQMNVISSVDGIQPNRIDWSGPGEFSTWDPSIDRSAGFNTLAAVEDQITGFLSLASVGIVLTQKGLVELSPTGVAIGPFDFTTLWTSEVGQGLTYYKSLCQYGQIGYLLTDSGAYQVSTGAGFSDSSGTAKKAILESIQTPNYFTGVFPFPSPNILPFVAGTVVIYFYNSAYSTPYYMVAGIQPANTAIGSTTPLLYVWFMDIKTGIWQEQIYNIDTLNNTQNGVALTNGTILYLNAETFNIPITAPANLIAQTSPFLATGLNNALSLIWIGVQYAGVNYSVMLTPYVYNKQNIDTASNPVGNLNLVFRSEELKLGFTRKPTVRRVVVKAYGFGTLTVNITDVAGVVTSLGTITLDGTTNPRTYYTPVGMATVEAPQLSIASTNFKGVIIKVMIAGTYADGEID